MRALAAGPEFLEDGGIDGVLGGEEVREHSILCWADVAERLACWRRRSMSWFSKSEDVVLTRIEIDGFKSFEDFAVDLQPLTVVVGPNAAGKSNLFDALRLLSRLVQYDVRTAFQEIRGDASELFRTTAEEASDQISISVEMLLPPSVEDPYGLKHELIHNRVRYSITVERRRERGTNYERLFVLNESASPIQQMSDRWFKSVKRPSTQFRKRYIASRRKSEFLETTTSDTGEKVFVARQDRTQGRGRHFPAQKAETSVLSGITSAAEFPHLYAIRTHLSNVRYLQLDPKLERNPSSFLAPDRMEPDGSNLAAVLARLRAKTQSEHDPDGVIRNITQALKSIIPGIRALSVITDEVRREHRLEVETTDGQMFSSRVLSDGTLRIICLLTLIYDLEFSEIVCFEEPENGIHEFRINQLVSTLRDASVDLTGEANVRNSSGVQFLVNTHSPIVMKNLSEHELIYADVVTLVSKKHRPTRATRMRPGVHDATGDGNQLSLTRYEIDQILHRPGDGV
jgi:predicted ATPase